MSKKLVFDRKNILVTGGAGFIGSHLCDELIKTAKVICLDDFSSGDERNIDHLLADSNFEFIRHDLSEPIDLDNTPGLEKFKIKFQGVQEIYHLACPSSPRNFSANRLAMLSANSLAMKNVLDLAVKYQAKILHFSSSVVYGTRRDGTPLIQEKDLGEVDILSERSAYDEGKRFAETMVKNYRDIFNLDTKIIRPFRIYGPRMKLDDDQMIPDFINSALEGKDLVIFGNEDFSSALCYVTDCIDAALKLMESDLAGPFNIGSDIDVKIKEVAERIIKFTESNSQIAYADSKLFISELNIPDISSARNELGWIPVTTLDRGLQNTIEDLRATKGLKRIG